MDKVPYTFLLDHRLFEGNSQKFVAKNIPELKYDTSLEERAQREWQEAQLEEEERRENIAQLTKQRRLSVMKPPATATNADEAIKSDQPKEDSPSLYPQAEMTDKISSLQVEAEEAANTYLPDESEGRRVAFQSIYVVGKREGATIDHCLQAFFLHPDEPNKAIDFLKAFMALRELGFPEPDISVALIQVGHDRDKAIDILMNQQ